MAGNDGAGPSRFRKPQSEIQFISSKKARNARNAGPSKDTAAPTSTSENIYLDRLRRLKGAVIENCVQSLALKHTPVSIRDALDVYSKSETQPLMPAPRCVVIGVLFREKYTNPVSLSTLYKLLRPCIRSYKDESIDSFVSVPPLVPASSIIDPICYSSDLDVVHTDFIVLQDETAKVRLLFSNRDMVDQLGTGLVIGVKGRLQALSSFGSYKVLGGSGNEACTGDTKQVHQVAFAVDRIILPGMAPQTERFAAKIPRPQFGSVYICILGGITIGAGTCRSHSLQHLIEYMSGNFDEDVNSTPNSENVLAPLIPVSSHPNIQRIIVCGNSLCQPTHFSTTDGIAIAYQSFLTEPLRQLDSFFAHLCHGTEAQGTEIDVMCGESDPTGYLMPQPAMSRELFPLATRHSRFHLRGNPFRIEVQGVSVVGTSGQNIYDYLASKGPTCEMSPETILPSMELFLNARHIAPSSKVSDYATWHEPISNPDRIWHADPFVLDHTPRIMFAGNQLEFGTKLVGNQTVLISVPAFNSSATAVLVNMDTLQCERLDFSL